jgi:hypothetical protein
MRAPASTRLQSTESTILFEGPLHAIIAKLAGWPAKDLDGVRVLLDGPRVRPQSFEAQSLLDLIASRPRN